jgi:hypothetical protein
MMTQRILWPLAVFCGLLAVGSAQAAPISLGEGLDATNLVWTTGGDLPWYATNAAATPSFDGVDAAVSGQIQDNQSSWLQTTVVGPGTLSFWWNVSSELDFDVFDFSIDGQSMDSISGENVNWEYRSFAIGAGIHTNLWLFSRDNAGAGGMNRAYLDQVKFTTGSAPTLGEALNSTNVVWTTGGNTNQTFWAGQTNVSHLDGKAAESGAITTSQESWMQTTVVGVTNVSFWWKVSSVTNHGWLGFYVNSNLQFQISGEVGWQSKTNLSLSAGTNVLRWRSSTDSLALGALNRAWVDEVVLLPTPTLVKTPATVALSNLAQVYDGTARAVTATTTPAGLTVNLTYNGSPNVPTNAGSYTVIGTINDLSYQGAATNNLIVTKASGSLALSNLAQVYDGTARMATATTTPTGLTVNLTYNGSTSPPTTAGTYTVAGTITDTNYQATTTNTLIVSKGSATVTLASLTQAYDGTPKPVSVATAPAGLAVDVTYSGSTNCPAAIGSYTVIAAVNDANYQGSATNTLAIQPVLPSITQQPVSQSIVAGSNVTFSVIASGTPPLAYQWRKTGSTLNGSTSAAYSIAAVGAGDAAGYDVVVSSAYGSVTSAVATLTVNFPPAAPNSLTAVAGDGKVALTWAPASGSTSYQVKSATTSGGPYAIIASGITSAAYTNTGLANGTVYYYVVAANNAYGNSPDSAQASARAVSQTPITLSAARNGGQLQLSWPADHIGWRLETQAHALATGLGQIWTTVSGSDSTNQVSLPLDPAAGCGFLRLAYP